MKNMHRMPGIPVLLILTAAFVFICAGTCKAWGPPKHENTEAFTKWYEENKNQDGAVYHLSGDLYLTEGTKESPIVWDGQGSVTIDCGGHGILVASYLLIDNPNLKIQGNSFFVVMVRSQGVLSLEQGTIDFEGEDGTGVHVMNGDIESPSQGNQFYLTGHGRNVRGLQYDNPKKGTLSNLNLNIEGTESAIGIGTELLVSLEMENCSICTSGGTKAYGVYGSGKTDFLLWHSRVSAAAESETGEVQSVFASEGKIKSEGSVLVPGVPGSVTYKIAAIKGQMPVYVEPGESQADWQLPPSVDMIVKESGSKEESVIPVSVDWQLPPSNLCSPGYCVVTGSLNLKDSDQILVNPDNVVPQVTVIGLPPERMFLISYETFSDGPKGAKLVIPYPYGAKTLKVEYSLDGGKTFQMYGASLGDNLLTVENPWMVKGLFSFYLDLPVSEQSVQLRTIVTGDSLFGGTSAVWTIGGDKEADESQNPSGGTNDDQGGDRGGQDSNPVFPDQGNPDGEDKLPPLGVTPTGDEESALGGEQGSPGKENNQGLGDESKQEPVKELHFKAVQDAQGGKTNQLSTWSATRKSPEGTDKGKTARQAKVQKAAPDKKAVGTSGKETSKEKAGNIKAAKAAEEKGGSNWLLFLAVVLGVAVIAAGGIWCGNKIFKKP